jgi:hypothetical protein
MRIILYLSICLLILSTACKKEEGKGGKYTITGKVFLRKYNPTWVAKIDSFYAPNEDVYIIYGDDVTYGDNQKTNYDGTYEFQFLRKGHYTVFAYSDTVNTITYNKVVKLLEVDLDSDKTVTLPDIIIYNN